MRNPFIARRPWAAFLVALLLHPFVGMLYIGRARLAGVYFLLQIGIVAVFLLIYPAGFGDLSVSDADVLFELPLTLFGAGHAAYLAWKYPFASPGRWYSRWYAVLAVPVAFVLLVLANRAFLYPFYYVPSHSMEPTIGRNDDIFASRLTYHFREPTRGDVITFYDPHRKATFVKRIIGVPHDRIEIRGGAVIVNGKPLPRAVISYMEYLQRERIPESGRSYTIRKIPGPGGGYDDFPAVTVPAGRYYVLGDNRENSLDSRFSEVGFIARADIVGPVAVRFFDGEARHFIWQPVR